MKLTLRYYQQQAINDTMEWLSKHDGNPLIVLPTGTGKALLCAELARIVCAYPGSNAWIVTHSRELVAQNYKELIDLWRDAPAGIYSASLKRRDLGRRITFAGVQSIYKRAASLPKPDLIIIDEAHLVPRDAATMYGALLAAAATINPHVRVIGLTATHYRMDSGRLDEGDNRIFHGISYEYSIRQAIADGYLVPLVSKDTSMHYDTSAVGTRGGEFIPGQLAEAVDTDPNNIAAVEETIAWGKERRSWLFFCSGVEHAEHISALVQSHGHSCAVVSANTPTVERDRIISDFKCGKIRAIASMNILTTGFNAPTVDLIAMLRPTKSVSLYIQMAGRGTRCVGADIDQSVRNGKTNCLVLDFAGNVSRFGPIDAVEVKPPGEGGGEAPFKVCPTCASILHAAAMVCGDCGHQFPKPAPKIVAAATTDAILSTYQNAEWVDIESVGYTRHEKIGSQDSLRVTYYQAETLDKGYSEWQCFEHPNNSFPQRKAANWWIARGGDFPVPTTVGEALSRKSELKFPTQILVRKSGKYWEVLQSRSQGPVRDVLEASAASRLQSLPREEGRA